MIPARLAAVFACATLLAVLWPAPAHARLLPTALVVNGDPVPLATVHPWGLLLHSAGADPRLSCWQRFDTAHLGLWTGSSRILVAGSEGAWLTLNGGCRYEPISGPAQKLSTFGMGAPVPGGLEVLLAVDDILGPATVVRSQDGGISALVAGELALPTDNVRDFVVRGEEAWLLAVAPSDGAATAWHSADRGLTFQSTAVSLPAEGLQVAAAGAETLWLWAGDTLRALDTSGALGPVEQTLSGAERAAVVDDAGVLWAGSTDGGLWRRDLAGTWTQASQRSVVALASSAGALWVAHAALAPGDPLVSHQGSDGASLEVVVQAPASWGYPSLCASITPQVCTEAEEALRLSLDLPPPSTGDASDEDPELTSGGGSGCAVSGAGPGLPVVLMLLAGLMGLNAMRRRRPTLG